MITIFHLPRARSHRIIWLCEEMGIPYQAKLEKLGAPSSEFLAANPLGTHPTIIDGDLVMFESIAIMTYLMHKYGPTDLDVRPDEPAWPRYLQFLNFGEASLGMYGNPLMATKFLCPEDQRDNWTIGYLKGAIAKRLGLLERELGESEFIAAGRFTSADISLAYSLSMMKLVADVALTSNLAAYTARFKDRPAFQRAIAA